MLKKTTQMLILSGVFLTSMNIQAASEDSQYRAALAQIKSGRYDKGLPVLKQLMLQNPGVSRYRYDYLAALSWAQRHDEVMALSRSWDINSRMPIYVLEAIGRSARVKGQFPRALEAYDAVLKQDNNRIFSRVGHALAKLGLGEPEEGEALMAKLNNQVGFRQELERGFLDYYLSRPELREKAIEFMAQLRQRYPNNSGYIYQQITVLSWAGHWNAALELSKSLSVDSMPPHILETLGRSARGLRQYSRALGYYEQALRKDAARVESRVGYVMALLDAIQDRRHFRNKTNHASVDLQDPSSGGVIDEKQQLDRERQQLTLAVQLLEPLNPVQHARMDVKEAWLRLQDILREDDYKILKIARAIQERNPKHVEAAAVEIDALNRQGASHLASLHPLFNQVRAALKWDVELSEIGQEIRSGQANFDTQVGDARYQKSEEALKHANDVREALMKSDFPERQSFIDRLDYDRMIVLNDLRRPDEVIQIYQDLEARKVSMPYFAYVAAASSYLSSHHTAKARDVFQKALELKPKDITASLGLYYAYLDNAQYEEALYIANWEIPLAKRDAQAVSAMAYAYTDYLNQAEVRMEKLVKEFPADYELRRNLATIYRYRDKPRQADEQYKWVAGALPNDHRVQVGRTYTNMSTNDYREAEKSLQKAEALAPRETEVKKARRDWETHNSRQLTVTADYGHGKPAGSVNGANSREPEVTWRLYSQPLNYDWRVFNEGTVASVNIPNINTTLPSGATLSKVGFKTRKFYTGVGAEYKQPNSRAEFSLGGSHYENDQPATYVTKAGTNESISSSSRVRVGGAYEYAFNDHWSIDGTAEFNTLNASIEASRRDVYGNRLAVGVTWAANESRRARLGLDFTRFSDGNRRWSWFAGWTERIITRPTYKLTASIETSISGNSMSANSLAPEIWYYNPERETYVGIGVNQEWLIDRFYTRSWKHRLGLSVGRLSQRGYGSSTSGGFNYEHIWAFDDRAELQVGVGRTRRFYDGQPDYRNNLNSTVNWRF